LRDLHSNDRETQLAAIHLVDKSGSAEIAKKLAEILLSGGFSAAEYELKSASVKALAEIGKPEIVPELIKVLKLLSLLGYKTLVRLKVDVVRSLEQYPAETVLPHLERLSAGSDAVAAQAVESLRNVRSRRL
jgi:HEAT repeat protein